jgi:hypothetical protein
MAGRSAIRAVNGDFVLAFESDNDAEIFKALYAASSTQADADADLEMLNPVPKGVRVVPTRSLEDIVMSIQDSLNEIMEGD